MHDGGAINSHTIGLRHRTCFARPSPDPSFPLLSAFAS
ncbi:hypothetical protein BURPS668_A0718 [Burkholderia pseudomallei 668]|uniref:Uncharacterized protein n=1 Tax=Burkholderia pseudomallei (strain 1106a) TaxID=357348 RepID=A3P2V2_BURP0|nr:hypothetical protein BURPS668_A0718 [Burkholderia pseudomallei 668]ABN93626.1 hypothetical protein BURPS1106A_A0626 [Burkholderia pseudomallei 1106a]EEC32467.1 conserved hypothetical protein [Burkholderia pseudomallei 576]